MNRKTIRWLAFTAILSIVCSAATVLLIRHFRTEHIKQCSAVYQRYVRHDGIAAAFIKDKHIPYADDPSGKSYRQIDMTVLMAGDSTAFAALMKEWGKSDEYIGYLMSRSADPTFKMVGIHPKGFPELPADTLVSNNDVTVIFPARRAVVFLHTTIEEEVITYSSRLFFNINQHKNNR